MLAVVFLSVAAVEKHEKLKTQNERLEFSVNKIIASAFLAININLSKFRPILVEVVICRPEQGAVTSGDM